MPRRLPILCVLTLALALGPVPAAADGAAGASPAAAAWVPPLTPLEVTRPFGPPGSPYGPGHRGVDLAGAAGTVVVAPGAGVVVFAGMVAGRPVVSVAHADGLRTTYEPVAPSVRAGMPVARGSPIGTLLAGHAGCPVAACLHWGLRRGEDYLDPLLLLHPPEVRLLPWTTRGGGVSSGWTGQLRAGSRPPPAGVPPWRPRPGLRARRPRGAVPR